jgi:molecular chaperone GrpE
MAKKKNDLKKNRDFEKKIEDLVHTIDEVEDEKLDIENKLKKALADYANLERNIEKRVETRLEEMKLKVAKNLLEIMDDFYYAIEAGKEFKADECVTSWMSGITNSYEKMAKTLEILGVEMIEVKIGDIFNHSQHEAVGIVKEGENDTIHEILQPGYVMGENTVRPVRVIVSKVDK